MKTNLLYDKIVNIYQQYLQYQELISAKEKDLEARKNDIAKILIESEFEEDVEGIAFEVFTEVSLYKNDLKILGHKLYVLVDGYVEVKELEPKLEDNILELCKNLESGIPKNNFFINNSSEIEEKEKGFINKVKEAQVKSGAIKTLVNELKSLLDI
jgi:hypothetical protein